MKPGTIKVKRNYRGPTTLAPSPSPSLVRGQLFAASFRAWALHEENLAIRDGIIGNRNFDTYLLPRPWISPRSTTCAMKVKIRPVPWRQILGIVAGRRRPPSALALRNALQQSQEGADHKVDLYEIALQAGRLSENAVLKGGEAGTWPV